MADILHSALMPSCEAYLSEKLQASFEPPPSAAQSGAPPLPMRPPPTMYKKAP